MSPLTKAFVVLVAVFSVLLVALVVPFVAKTEDFKGKHDDARIELAAAEKLAKSRQAELAALQSQQSEQITALTGEVASLTSQLVELQSANAKLESQSVNLTSQVAARDANLSAFAAAGEQNAALLGALTSELGALRGEQVDLQTKLIQQVASNAELTSQLDSFLRQLRQVKESAASKDEQLEELNSIINQAGIDPAALAAGSGTAEIVPQTPIAGNITKVDDADGLMLVLVDVGANDGVQENMKFLVHRGSEFLGTMTIEAVEPDSAVGQMQLVKGSLSTGDSVYAGKI